MGLSRMVAGSLFFIFFFLLVTYYKCDFNPLLLMFSPNRFLFFAVSRLNMSSSLPVYCT